MAGDWLKFEKSTPDKPEVFAIAADLGIDPDAVVGKLMRIWSWFDSHTENGNAPSVTSALLDRIAGVTGFVQSMQKCGWIEVHNGGISLPNFYRHCGVTAKQRAQNNKRVSNLRARNAESVTEPLQKHVPEKRREEKKREEEKQVDAPNGDSLKKSSSKASRLPADWQPDEVLLAWAKAERPDLNLKLTVDSFRDYWIGKSGKDATKTDWPATFRNWVRREKQQAVPTQPAEPKDYRRPLL